MSDANPYASLFTAAELPNWRGSASLHHYVGNYNFTQLVLGDNLKMLSHIHAPLDV